MTNKLLIALFSGITLLNQPVHGQDAVKFIIQSDHPQQTMEYFSASDAWSMNRIGLWSENVQTQVADWLFSTENDEKGYPKGIGLSLWRFNIGA